MIRIRLVEHEWYVDVRVYDYWVHFRTCSTFEEAIAVTHDEALAAKREFIRDRAS